MQISWPQNVSQSFMPDCQSDLSALQYLPTPLPTLRHSRSELSLLSCADPGIWPPHIKSSLWRMLIFAQVHLTSLPLWAESAPSIQIYQRPKGCLVLLSLCVRTGDGSGWHCVLSPNKPIHTRIHRFHSSSWLLGSVAFIWTPSFLSSWWPSDLGLPLGQGAHGQDSWGQQEPCPNQIPSCLLPFPSHDPCVAFELVPPDTEAGTPLPRHPLFIQRYK